MTSEPTQANWFKSSHSAGGQDCVEVAFLDGDRVGVRDSKNPHGPALVFDAAAWSSFTAGISSGRFDSTD